MSDLVIITGASSGLGLAIAGSTPFPARIVDISRSGPPEGSGWDHIESDLSDVAEWPGVTSAIAGLVDEERPERAVLVHAAGTLAPIGFAGEVDTGEYTRNIILNSASGQVLGHAFLAAVRDRSGRFDLVMITSGAASSPYAGWSSYGAGKAALDQWVRSVGEEQKLRGGVRVSAIAPGVLDTPMQGHIRETSEKNFPNVSRFRDLHREHDLVDPETAAIELWRAVEGGLEPGAVIDLRDI